MTAFEIRIRRKCFPALDRAPARVALQDLRVDLAPGEFVCVFGPSGCGKTTLLNIVAGLDRDFEGRVTPAPGAPAGPRIGYVFQSPRLLPWLTVLQNVELVLGDDPRPALVAGQLLGACGLADAHHVTASRLSMGMSRRVALARAFAVAPALLLMDEPFVSLDEPAARRLRRLLVEVWRSRPTNVLFVTHDLAEAIQLADRILFLSAAPGRVVADVDVDLPREKRGDRDQVEAWRAALPRDIIKGT